MTYATLSKKAATVRLRIIFCTEKMRERHEWGFSNRVSLVQNVNAFIFSKREGQIIDQMITDVADSLAYDVPSDNSVKISEEIVPLIPSIETAVSVFL